jgi:hypothetical protein
MRIIGRMLDGVAGCMIISLLVFLFFMAVVLPVRFLITGKNPFGVQFDPPIKEVEQWID